MFGSVQINGSYANAQSISPLMILAEVSPSSNLHAIQIQCALTKLATFNYCCLI